MTQDIKKSGYRLVGTGLACLTLLATGCQNPDGSTNNTATGALVGGAFGALTGAAIGGRHHGAQDALIGAAAGLAAGVIVGSIMDHINAQQKAKLQQSSPQTLQTLQHNDQVARQPAPPPQPTTTTTTVVVTVPAASTTVPAPAATPAAPSAAPAAAAPAAPAPAPVASTASAPSAAPASADAPIPLKVDDIKAMSGAGIKPDAIIEAIKESKAVYTAADVQAARQATPPVDPQVIAFMQNPTA